MRYSTTLVATVLAAITTAQTDVSPPFNPDPSFTATLPEGEVIITIPSITPIDPATVTGSASITFFTETSPGPYDPPVLTGRPDPRPSNFPGPNSTAITLTESSSVDTVIVSGSQSITTSALITTTRTTAVSSGATTTTGISPSITNQPAAAGKMDSGLMTVVGGLVVGVLGAVVGL